MGTWKCSSNPLPYPGTCQVLSPVHLPLINKSATNLLSQKREYTNGEQQTLLALQNQVQHPICLHAKVFKVPKCTMPEERMLKGEGGGGSESE